MTFFDSRHIERNSEEAADS